MSQETTTPKTCFVVMPISDADGYESGHFARVYNHIIKPACKNAGFEPVRADDVKQSNMIILDILKRILEADIVVCDLSSRNPNVMYELGIRHAFNMPVVLLKDKTTTRIFDISSLRDVEYDGSLRIDTVQHAIKELTNAIVQTYEHKDTDTNSLIKLLGMEPAKIEKTEINPDTQLILQSLGSIMSSLRVHQGLETRHEKHFSSPSANNKLKSWYKQLKNRIGAYVSVDIYGDGHITDFDDNNQTLLVNFGQDSLWVEATEITLHLPANNEI